ncbi:MAG: glycosyltransferase family 4 protein [Clostridiales bacterium]|nr:glycosyltransferase family 4 protein [Clostridiales bacterium]
MIIQVVTQYFYPEPMRINDIVKVLVEKGHTVNVLTGIPNYPEGKVLDDYKGKNYKKHQQEVIFGANVVRSRLIGRGKGSLRLLLNYISFALFASIKARSLKKNADVVFIQQHSPITLCKPAYVYARRAHCPVVLNCLDLWPESITSRMYLSEKSFLYKRLKNYCKRIYNKATVLIATSSGFADYFTDVLGMNRDVIHIPQYAEDIFNAKPMPKTKGLNLLFAGNVGKSQSVDTIIRAASLLKDKKDIHWHIVGDGSALNECKALADDLGVSHQVTFHGRQPLDTMPKFYETADILLVTLKANHFIELTLPGKVQTYMAAGRPILAAAGGETTKVIEDAKCGLACASEDFISLAKNVDMLLKNNKALAKYASNARAYYEENYSQDKFFNDIIRTMEISVECTEK